MGRQNLKWVTWAIERRYLRDPTFRRFCTVPACDGQMDRHTMTAYTALA